MSKVGDVINLQPISEPDAVAGHIVVFADGTVFSSKTPDRRVAVSEQLFPCHASLFADEAECMGGSSVITLTTTIVPYQLLVYQDGTPTVGDRLIWKPMLQAGTYRLRTIGQSLPSAGQSAIQINGVTVATSDWYSAVSITPDVREHVGVSVPTSGVQEITFRITGKHASSSNFYFVLACILMTRTGA